MRSFEQDLAAARESDDELRHNFTKRSAAVRAELDRVSESALAKAERALQPKETKR